MQANFDNLIVGIVFLGLFFIFAQSVLNAIYPGLFKMILKLVKTLVVYLIELLAWLLKLLLALFKIDLTKKQLPGRNK